MAVKPDYKKIEKEAKKIAEEILKQQNFKVEIKVKPEENLIVVNISGEDLGLFIGHRGAHLESLQLVIGLILNKRMKLDSRIPVLVDVGNWRKQREEALEELLEKHLYELKKDKKLVELPPMTPAQRRTIHVLVKNHKDLTSESKGEEPYRHVIIKKAS